MRYRAFTVMVVAAALAGCGGGGSSGSNQNNNGGPNIGTGGLVLLQFDGNAAKGPLRSAGLNLYEADADGNRATISAIGSTTTNTQGNWSLSVMTTSGAHIIESDGGIYTDESDSNPDPALKREIQLSAGETFESLMPNGETTAALNIFSNALLEKSRNESLPGEFLVVFGNNRTLHQQAFGFDVVSTLPADPLLPDPAATESERQYAMALGGLAYVLNDVAVRFAKPVPDYAMMRALVADLSDCRLDGNDMNGQVLVNIDGVDQPFPGNIDLNTQIIRFRNNNITVYQNTPLIQIDEALCSQSGAPVDSTAPTFTFVPSAFTVAAIDANGTPGSDPAIQNALNSVTAVDNRPGPVTITNDAPGNFPLGDTLVTFTATDVAGNEGLSTVRITVDDQAAPQITAPADIIVVTTGPLTPVNLGQPVISDNVTPAGLLIVTNDAPVNGFPVGIHSVNWTVTDEVGLWANDQQQVTVRTPNAPNVVVPIPDAAATEGVPVAIDVSGNFDDADGDSLTFVMQGLPAGSGLVFDGLTGILSGTPNDVDAKASAISLTVTASDGILTASDTFDLSVTDVNNLPSFSLSGDLLLDEDFAGVQTATVIPDPVSADEVGQVVIYSINPDPATIPFAGIVFDMATGQVDVNSITDLSGSQVFTITADDGQAVNNLYAQNLLLAVRSVNDPPTFTLSGDVELPVDFAGVVNVTVAPGPVPADESAQIVAYSISPPITFANISIDPATGLVSITSIPGEIGSQLMIVVAEDGQTENGTWGDSFTLTIGDPPPAMQKTANDQDADGLSDQDEKLFGTDPDNPDSDSDGIGDGTEVNFASDPLRVNANAIYVGSNPAGPINRIAELDLTTPIAAGESGLPSFILLEQGVHNVRLRLAGSCDYIVIAGSFAPGDWRSMPGAYSTPTTTLKGINGSAVAATDCSDLQIANTAITESTASGLRLVNSTVIASRISVHLNSNSGSGGGISVTGGALALIDSLVSANQSAVSGGGLYANDVLLDIRHSTISGNSATRGGGIAVDNSRNGSALFNVLINSNRAEQDPAMQIGINMSLANLTVADNQSAGINKDTERLPLASMNEFTDSVIVDNPSITNVYARGYYLVPGNKAIDSGMLSSDVAGLDDRFATTAITPDSGPVDAGYHHARRFQAPGADLVATVGSPSPTASIIRLQNGNRWLGPGHRVCVVTDNGPSIRCLADLGDGRYLFDGALEYPITLDVDGLKIE